MYRDGYVPIPIFNTPPMKYLLYLFLFFTNTLSGQSGFIKTFQYKDSVWVRIQNVVFEPETNHIIMAGVSQNPITFYQGVYIREIDTLGNLIRDTVLNDDTQDHYGIGTVTPFFNTSDGNYAALPSLFFADRNVFLKIDKDFNVIQRVLLEEDTIKVQSIQARGLFEVPDGYIVHSRKQHLNYRAKPHLTKINKEGVVQWEKEYGSSEYKYTGLITQTENGFILSGSRSDDDFQMGSPSQGYLLELDTNGDIIKNFMFNQNEAYKTVNYRPTIKDFNTNYITNSSITQWVSGDPYTKQLQISKYDSELNEIWTTPYGPSENYATLTAIKTISVLENNNILVSGDRMSDDLQVNPTFLLMLSSQGDILWSREDSINYAPHDDFYYPAFNSVNKHIILPSGSIAMVGDSHTEREPYGNTTYGFIIKVDKDGCIDSGCRETVSTAKIKTENNITVFPNPSTGIFTIKGMDNKKIEIVNTLGQLIYKSEIKGNETTINLSSHPDGIYYMKSRKDNGIITKMLVKRKN